MALQPCRECGHEVSTEAQTCPHCGAGQPAVNAEHSLSAPFAKAPQRRVWPTLGCLGLLGFLLWAIGQGTHDQPPSLALGQLYRVKRSLPACPSTEDLSRIMSLVAAKDYDATSRYIIRQGCVVLQAGWEVAYDGRGGFGVVKIRRPGNPDVFFAPKESIE
jgi:hypothetical protein